jgi:hypothetical protein
MLSRGESGGNRAGRSYREAIYSLVNPKPTGRVERRTPALRLERGIEPTALLSAWRDYRAVAEEYRELADVSIVALTAFHARGRASEIEVRQVLARGASVMRIDDGKVTKVVLYYSRDRALADLGLEG